MIVNIYFGLRFSLANAINNYLRLKKLWCLHLSQLYFCILEILKSIVKTRFFSMNMLSRVVNTQRLFSSKNMV